VPEACEGEQVREEKLEFLVSIVKRHRARRTAPRLVESARRSCTERPGEQTTHRAAVAACRPPQPDQRAMSSSVVERSFRSFLRSATAKSRRTVGKLLRCHIRVGRIVWCVGRWVRRVLPSATTARPSGSSSPPEARGNGPGAGLKGIPKHRGPTRSPRTHVSSPVRG